MLLVQTKTAGPGEEADADGSPWAGKEASSRLSTALPGSTKLKDCGL